jgi:hypothetical protein
LFSRKSLLDGRPVDIQKLVKNLFDCLNGNPYALNEDAVIAHVGNIRVDHLNALFKLIDIENIFCRVCHTDAMKDWFIATKKYSLDKADCDVNNKTLEKVIEIRLNDIVERRNQVAHGGHLFDELPGIDYMREMVNFIKSLATSIFGFVAGSYLQLHHGESSSRIELALRVKNRPFENSTIVVVDKPAQRLSVGQPVFVIVKSIGARWGRILSLQVNDVDVHDVGENESAPNGIGVKLDFKFPSAADAKLFALENDDALLWSSSELVIDKKFSTE